jgi:capreomycidine synthase
MTLADIAPAALEDWFRHRYFDAKIDISCSGMPPASLSELGLDVPFADVRLQDSPSLGSERLRTAIAARYAPGRADRVMVTSGSSEAIFLALAALIRPGDEVVVMRPAYQSLVSVAAALGATLRHWDLAADEGFRPRLDRLAGLVTAATRVVIVNFPHNPTGVTLTAAECRELVTLVEASGCHLLWDGAFTDLTYDAPPLETPTAERCVATGTLSKSYGLPGIRVGWCLASPGQLRAMVRIRDYLTLNVSPLNELAAAVALDNAESILARQRAMASRGLAVLTEWAARRPGLVSLPVPRGGVTAFPDFGMDTFDLAVRLSERHGVLVVPGSCFGHPGRMRIGFGVPEQTLRDGLAAVDSELRGSARPW